MEYAEEDFLMLSGIQHFVFCRRQWALIHIEQQWEENVRTFEGAVMHENAHNPLLKQKTFHLRKKRILTQIFHRKISNLLTILTVRAMRVFSRTLGISGECDVVEFHADSRGVPLHGREGTYLPIPVEYKRGAPKKHDADALQLAAQAMCLEEMLLTRVETGYLYYGETKHREEVAISEELREKVRKSFAEMHQYYERGYTPRAKREKHCSQCSLRNICMPELSKSVDAQKYVDSMVTDTVLS